MAQFRLFSWIASGVTGMLAGACLISHAYAVQGGEPRSFALIGATTGGMIAVAYARGYIRLSFVGAACGSIAALTFFQVTVCDGSHIILPMAGAVAGLALFGVAGRGLSSIARRRDSKSAASLTEFRAVSRGRGQAVSGTLTDPKSRQILEHSVSDHPVNCVQQDYTRNNP